MNDETMESTLKTAIDIMRLVAEQHLMDEHGHLHGTSSATHAVIGFLLKTGDAEYHELLDPVGGQVIRREIRLIQKPTTPSTTPP